MDKKYLDFLGKKSQCGNFGFDPVWIPDFLFDFQRELVSWAIKKGRGAIFADCGMGKTPMQLVWAENVVRKTNKPVLIFTPLAVAQQTVREGEKFGIEVLRSEEINKPAIYITNYQRLHRFNRDDFTAVVCDESSILKSFNGATKAAITEFMRTLPYRLLCTATAAPNDYMELGTSSEALGYLGYMDMLSKFFKNDRNTAPSGGRYFGKKTDFRLKRHAEKHFWGWICSWARALRRPSDLGFDDADFILTELIEKEEVVETKQFREGLLFPLPAIGLAEQREERRITINERCERAAEIVDTKNPALCWCHLNDEGDLLEKMIPGSVQVSGKDSDESKEDKFLGFGNGDIRVLITKPKIGAWGLNWQHCSHMTFFASHSFEQYYQGVRRCWRFGQTKPVTVNNVTSEGERGVLENLQRKSEQADKMFSSIVRSMKEELEITRTTEFDKPEEVPTWLS